MTSTIEWSFIPKNETKLIKDQIDPIQYYPKKSNVHLGQPIFPSISLADFHKLGQTDRQTDRQAIIFLSTTMS